MREFSTLDFNNEIQNYKEQACEKLSENLQNQYKKTHKIFIWEKKFCILHILSSTDNNSDFLKLQQFYSNIRITKNYTARNSKNMLLTWKKILLTENINFKNCRYYKKNKIFMNSLQQLKILQLNIYTNHSEFDVLWTKYKKKPEKWENFRNCRTNTMRRMKRNQKIQSSEWNSHEQIILILL